MVRLQAGFVLEIIRRGNMRMKKATWVRMIVKPLLAKAQASLYEQYFTMGQKRFLLNKGYPCLDIVWVRILE